ncbi:protein of unknown function DUF1822 [Stanieria cyanosphaera PCC 7437]|uniref:DUF1822 family protein n=1 Tax=Stanieria cyanosphaera (strain ATCC 29371 / PCC 7437) TaxID=111780 RepID=K9XU92_STAC7|nr:DUF1822 family protein [Stanieria cyanosphaera]AFZ35646.1 protein of unknown function DUF1822 [Stanieria cyanosphaera PCC 7437]
MSDLALFNPTDLVLEFSDKIKQEAWRDSQAAATPTSRWQVYLNQVALSAVLPWLREEQTRAVKVASQASLASIWEVVNGTSLAVGDHKLVIIPSEADDLSEIRVPQEWVDLPQWTGDYYLAVQVNLDDNYVRVWGYTTHQKLKTVGQYQASDRTYSLTEDHLITDLDVLLLAWELCPEEVTQVEVAALPAMSATQANNLIQRLGNVDILLPRMAIPFQFWAALIKPESWRKRLVQQRRGLPVKGSVVEWLKTEVANVVEEFGWRQVEFQPSMVGARGANNVIDEFDAPSEIALAKQLTIANQPYELKIIPLDLEDGLWRFELRSLALGGLIPAGTILRLLTEDLEAFEGNEDIATTAVEELALEVGLEAGEGLVWQVIPTPENYEPEILKF